ncbi:MAG: toprim domain-containing protein [Candidatus Methanoperedens sp.]|nr:toprim domain-containing protein [Candidatus Methanoperedens sp.]
MNTSTIEDIERLEKLEELILELQELADGGAIIVVEGRKDVDSLRFLGIKGEIRLSSQQPLLEFTELLSKSGKEIVLLTDWDKKGGMVAHKIIQHLLAYGIMPNTQIRAKIRTLTKKRIKDIESLNNHVNKLRYEIHGITKI